MSVAEPSRGDKSGCCGGTKYHSAASPVYVADSTVSESLSMVDWSSFDVQNQYMLSLQSSMWTDNSERRSLLLLLAHSSRKRQPTEWNPSMSVRFKQEFI